MLAETRMVSHKTKSYIAILFVINKYISNQMARGRISI